MRLFLRTALFLLIVCNGWLRAAEYQWSVPMEPTTPDPAKHSRAFLWIPPACQRVRAVVLGQQGMLEDQIFESPEFRQAMSDLDFAIVWVAPGFDPVFQFDHGAGDHVEVTLKALADQSGYGEIAEAPIVPIGTGTNGSFPWNFAAWNPDRSLAAISIHGNAPLDAPIPAGKPNPDWGKRNINGVPGLMVVGTSEWLLGRLNGAAAFHKKYPDTPLSVVCDGGEGGYDFPDNLTGYLAVFLQKAVAVRLAEDGQPDGSVKLKPVDPGEGWLLDQWNREKTPPAPFADFAGDRVRAYWCFDREMAWATDRFRIVENRKPQYLGFEENEEPVPDSNGMQVLKFGPLPDGISIHIKGIFLDTVPPGHPLTFSGTPAGSHLDHAAGGGPVIVSRIAGPLAQTAPGMWAVQFDRGSDVTNYEQMTDQIWLFAKQGGDDHYAREVRWAQMTIPMHNLQGSDQHITFPPIPNQTNATGFVKLAASSDSGLPVVYYVREGPAEIEGNTLVFTPVPPRAKYPIKVTVVAWQYGSSTHPRVKSAEPVTQVFTITR